MAAHRAMPPMTSAMSAIVLSSSGSAGASGGRVSVSASGHTVGRITVTPIGSGWHPGSAGPQFQMTPIATGGDTGGSSSTTTTGSNTGSGGTTTPSPPPQTGHLPGHFLLGPDGQPAAIVF